MMDDVLEWVNAWEKGINCGRTSTTAMIRALAAEVRKLREALAEPWRHFACPTTQQSCDRMCLTMCHRRSEELTELRKDRERLDWLDANEVTLILHGPHRTSIAARDVIDAALSSRGEDAGE